MIVYRLIKKRWRNSADLSAKRRSAFLMRPRLMERSEHKPAVELILGIFDVKDLTPQEKGGDTVMRRHLNRKGQSTLEYVIIWTAIVAAILFAANQFLKPAIEGAVGTTSTKVTEEVGDLVGGIGN